MSNNFSENEFKRLYKRWIDNSIENDNAKVLGVIENKELVGFISFKKNLMNHVVELISVKEGMQGKGLGRKLIYAAEGHIEQGDLLMVSTQLKNEKACKFYEALGFEFNSVKYIYHYEPNTL